ncbi:HK97-gp10 family putative phage morphogenesis protein [Rummeliibacillus sp. POC4]|uniref:HK97-gp10 family putative phage morphogenesis protein n=1 Tax=Rummeliibacillus sp. POC4 TaxID=2305899 RepID=UPI000E6628A3|nr:HK97-gp10 family putative phage morphogenesis protein [Rummeliibacillus sp. POC4]RIJ64087.1 HK97 gp10 family phage protein [Rummeliibacillus sp. POC4]
MSITRFGSKELERALNKWSDKIEKEVKRIIHETALLIQSEARALAPEDSGYLRKSITIDLSSDGLTALISVGADYGIYIEYGTGIYAVNGNGRKDPWVFYDENHGKFVFTHGMRAKPFWFPAIEVGKKYYEKEMKKLGR